MKSIIKILVLLLTSLTLISCGGGGSQQHAATGNGGTTQLKRSTSEHELTDYLRASLIHNYATQTMGYYELASVSDDAGNTASGAFSTTNTQEASVDEADRLKTDGQYLYTSAIQTPEIQVFAADAQARQVASLTLDTLNQSKISGLFLRPEASQLLALSGDGQDSHSVWDMWFGADYWQQRHTELFVMDIGQVEAPEQQHKLTLDGQLISSRRIGSMLYLVTRHTPSLDGLNEHPLTQQDLTNNRSVVNQANLADMLPMYQMNGGDAENLFEAPGLFRL